MNVALCPDSLNLISICTGGGGLDLGVELAIPNARSVCMVEREAFGVAQLVSAMQQGLLAPAPVWSDARTFDGRAWRGAVDGLIGGIPCQPHSLAGKRLEREDPRDLWSTARRIIVQSGAWFVLIENVEGMLSSGGAERVYGDLGRLGFAREVGLFTASEVGASHQRERTFILAVADRDGVGQSGFSEFDGRQKPGREASARWGYADGRGSALADARGARWGESSQAIRGRESELAGDCAPVEHTASIGRGEGRPEPELRGGGNASARADCPMGNADSIGELKSNDQNGADPRSVARRRIGRARVGLFPPGPSDLSSWRDTLNGSPELEPAFRRVADGLASRLDTARVDRLRMLGNGVVPLQAAYAVRTLATRLASRGSGRRSSPCSHDGDHPMRKLTTQERQLLALISSAGGSVCPGVDASIPKAAHVSLRRMERAGLLRIEETQDGARFHLTAEGKTHAEG